MKSYFPPFTPRGSSAISAAPPWHYSGDVLAVEFWPDASQASALLPPGVVLDNEGRSTWLFIDWQFTGENDEMLDPARYQYREALVTIDARFEGSPLAFCPFIFVDNDASLARGWAQGFPKRIGSVSQTRSFKAPGPASGSLAAGGRFGASVSTHGERLVGGRVTLQEPLTKPPIEFARPLAMRRYFPRLTEGDHGRPAVDELTLSIAGDMQIADAWVGEAALTVPIVQGEDIHLLAPKAVGRGFRFSTSYTVKTIRTLRDYSAEAASADAAIEDALNVA